MSAVDVLKEDVEASEMNKSRRIRKTKMMMKLMNLIKIKKMLLILRKMMNMCLHEYVELYDTIFTFIPLFL